jgi:hypothetical protein
MRIFAVFLMLAVMVVVVSAAPRAMAWDAETIAMFNEEMAELNGEGDLGKRSSIQEAFEGFANAAVKVKLLFSVGVAASFIGLLTL